MKHNPMLNADDRTLKIYGNTAVVRYVDISRKYIYETGEMEESVSYTDRTVSVGKVDILSCDIPNGKGYLAGDAFFEVSRKELERALPQGRDVSSGFCGIIPESDIFILNGTEYAVVKISPLDQWANIPAKYKFHCRTSAKEV